MVDIKPLDALELWSRPSAGQLPRWVRGVIGLACAITVLVVAACAHVLWRMDGQAYVRRHLDVREPVDSFIAAIDRVRAAEWLFQYGAPLVVLAILAVAFLPRSSVSRFVRMAIVLPLLHVLVLLVAWRLIPMLQLPSLGERTPLTRDLPPLPIALLVGGAIVTAGAFVPRKRRDRIHAIVMLALANLLLLGLWAAVASRWLAGKGMFDSWDTASGWLASPAAVAVIILVPPFVVALAFTTVAINRPALAHRLRAPIVLGACVLFGLAVGARVSSYQGAFLLYDNVVHIVLAAAMIALVATCALAITTFVTCRRASARLARAAGCRTGVISDEDDHVVACLEVSSWLRGPRMIVRSFTAVTPAGDVLVPAGAEVATSIPLVSSVLRNGEAVVVLRQADQVRLGGFVERETQMSWADKSPFRSAHVVIPGPDGIVVGHAAGDETTALQSMGLAAWRPSVAYMLIVIAVAVPGLLGLFAPTWR